MSIVYLDGEDEAQSLVAEIDTLGRKAITIQTDIRDPEAAINAVEKSISELGRLDILVNNAGIAPFKPFLEISLEAWNDTLNTNLRGAFICSQAAAQDMVKRGFGRIVHITSTLGQVAVPDLAHYSASKGGLVMLAKSRAIELGPLGVTVNCVGPSTIKTAINAALLEQDNMAAREAALNPRRRIGRPADIAAAVAFLCSDEADWINGQNIMVDGGLTAMSPQPPYLPD